LAQPFPGFVDSLFARLALRYDQRMVGDLKYDLPDKVVQEIENLGYEAGSFSRLLDLGCGTGLIAKALQKSFEIGERTGMDLCRGMLVQAAQGGHYHLLIQGDVLTAMGEASGMYDLITAVDLIPYIGDLTNLGIQIADRMTERGLVVL